MTQNLRFALILLKKEAVMAAPQTHLTLLVLLCLVLLAPVLSGFALHFTVTEFIFVVFWGFGFDFLDHILDPNPKIMWIGFRDILCRIGGGLPDSRLKNKKPYLHMWPVLFFLAGSSLLCAFLGARWWVPWFGYLPHIFLDRFQRAPAELPAWTFWRMRRVVRGGYEIKERPEFVLVAAFSLTLCLYLVGFSNAGYLFSAFVLLLLIFWLFLSKTIASLVAAVFSSIATALYYLRFIA